MMIGSSIEEISIPIERMSDIRNWVIGDFENHSQFAALKEKKELKQSHMQH